MNSRFARNLLLATALAAVGGSAVAGMSMGSSGSRNDDRDSGYYPGYGRGGGSQPCRGSGPCTRDDDDRQDYGQGMRMGGRQGGSRPQRNQYRQQYRYGQGGPGYGRGGQGYAPGAPGAPGADQSGQDEYQGGPGYGRGGPGAAPSYRQGGGF